MLPDGSPRDPQRADPPGPCLVFGADMGAGLGDTLDQTLRVVRRAGCPLLTANSTLVELSAEQVNTKPRSVNLKARSPNFKTPKPENP